MISIASPVSSVRHDDLLAWCGPARERFRRGELVFRAGRFQWPFVIVAGAMRLDLPAGDDSALHLALPGDLLGFEQLIGQPQSTCGRAIVETVIAPLGAVPEGSRQDLLIRQLAASHRRAAEQGRLRFGPASERIRALLLMLAQPDHAHAEPMCCELPRLSDIAALTDTAPETASRVLSSLRRSGLIAAGGEDAQRSVQIGPLMHLRAGEMPAGMTRSRTGVAHARAA
ncbi:Crp/Fnr family transcriptional regulator [Sphaerotilus sp.]|uniref:Crp/Fnr family transcriptional regulator n=1 Tax=Sphaerotilus sp. TaxID=2093942 RepID=UPI0034E210AB